MKLNRAEMELWWRERSAPAVFTAQRGPNIRHSPSVMVYPLKSGRGFLWLIWHGKFGVKDMAKNIKSGATTARDFERAVKLAVHELLVYRGKANE
jgi:hypothetical protein